MAPGSFEVVCEVQPPTRPDLMPIRHQIGVLSRIATAFLVPDNHLGRATISSVAVAHEVDQMGGRSIACLNARDRNLLGFRRDLMTAAAYRVDEFLLVFGDRPAAGERAGELTVRSMLEEMRRFSEASGATGSAGRSRLQAGVTTRLSPLPRWKSEADFLFVQASFDLERLLEWRATVDFEGRVFAGVLVPPSAARARKWVSDIPEISIPQSWLSALEADPASGIELACELALAVRDSSAFDGIHLIPGVRYREVASALEPEFS